MTGIDLGFQLIFIHGAWQGAWAWSALVPKLEWLGYRCKAIDLPGNGWNDTYHLNPTLDDHAEFVLASIRAERGPAVIVAHSGGGLAATAVAEKSPQDVLGIVYVAGMLLPSDVSFRDFVRETAQSARLLPGIPPRLVDTFDGRATVCPPDAAIEIFYSDCPLEQAEVAASKLTPQPVSGRDVAAHWTAGRFGRVPRAHIKATEDRSIDPILQTRMQEILPDTIALKIQSGHAPQLSRPDELAHLIDGAVAQFDGTRQELRAG